MQMIFTEDDQVVQALVLNRSDDSLGVKILPGRTRRDDDLLDAHARDSASECLCVDAVPIPEKISGYFIEGKRFNDLLCRPLGSGMDGYVEVNQLPALMLQHDETEQDAERGRRDSEEVNGCRLSQVVLHEGSPGLRGWFGLPDHVSGHR